MKTGINLLPHFEEESERETQLKKWLTISATIILIFASILVMVLLVVQIRLKRELVNIMEPTKKLEVQISEQRDKEAALRILKIKTGLALKISSEFSPFLDVLQFLKDNKPEGIIFSDISLPDTKRVNFSGSAANALSFGELLKNLLDKDRGKSKFASLQLESFTGGKIGDYSFSFSAQLLNTK